LASISRQDHSFSESSGPISPSPTSLETGSLSILKSSLERLINVISRDAIDGNEVWKTVSFMLLDSLARLSCAEKQHIVLSALVRQGVLHNVVRDLKESDLRLQAILKPDPGSYTCRISEVL
jgi:nuclear pore complex protein Nup205